MFERFIIQSIPMHHFQFKHQWQCVELIPQLGKRLVAHGGGEYGEVDVGVVAVVAFGAGAKNQGAVDLGVLGNHVAQLREDGWA